MNQISDHKVQQIINNPWLYEHKNGIMMFHVMVVTITFALLAAMCISHIRNREII